MDFYLSEGITYVCFNVEEEEGEHRTSSLAVGSDASAAYAAYLRRFVKRMQTDQQAPRCREVDAVTSLITAGVEARRHNPQVNPLEIVSVAVNGDMSTYSPELMGVRSDKFNNFIFGNVLTHPVEAISWSILLFWSFVTISNAVYPLARRLARILEYVAAGLRPTNSSNIAPVLRLKRSTVA